MQVHTHMGAYTHNTHIYTDTYTDTTQTQLGMGDNKNFMLRYIIRVINTIIDIITISLNSATGTKIVKISQKYFTDMNVSEQ